MIGDKLKLFRERENISIDEISKSLNLSKEVYIEFEKNTIVPDLLVLEKIAEFLEIDKVCFLEKLKDEEMEKMQRNHIINEISTLSVCELKLISDFIGYIKLRYNKK